MQWQSASQENPYAPTSAPWLDTTTDLMPDAVDDTDPQLAAEALPDEIMDARGSRDVAPEDDAAASAEAARAAAADVHSVESTAAVVDAGVPASPVLASAT